GHLRSDGSKRYWVDVLGMGNVIAETNLSNSPTAYYIYGAGGLEARILPDGTAEYYVSDYRGSIVAMVDASANITHKYQYDEFGKVIQKDESDANPFRYVGKYGVMYANDNLYYMRARFYDPTIGRFLSEDPIWSTNLYPYADNNPVMGIDPMGLSTLEELYKANQQYLIAKRVYEIAKNERKEMDGFWWRAGVLLGYAGDEYDEIKENFKSAEKRLAETKKTVYYDIDTKRDGYFVNQTKYGNILSSEYLNPKLEKKTIKLLLNEENRNKSYEEWLKLQYILK
ncbi:MAG: RHS repeat-associated core domain-containing protein, partial [Bacteroidales bacterium]|nr:RHS repeat-associated core domain-containing protein [Bacteroidales bacterium]